MFQIGDQVVIREDSRYYDTDKSNPSNSIIGVITYVHDYMSLDPHDFRVEWSSGTKNIYREQDLELVKEVDIEDWV